MAQSTPVNLSNHAFFNLGGKPFGTIHNHILKINADRFTSVDEILIPFGENAFVERTPFDFRKGNIIGKDLPLQESNEQLKKGKDTTIILC